jgi:hypothetical protein
VSEIDRQRNVAPGEVDDAERLATSDTVAPELPLDGQLGSASGGYGTGSAGQTSGGTGAGDDATSVPGEEPQTHWLRDASGGRDRDALPEGGDR